MSTKTRPSGGGRSCCSSWAVGSGIADPARIQNSVEVVAFVLDHARMEAGHFALEWVAQLIEPGVADMCPARHHAAHSGYRQAPFPTIFGGVRQRRDHRIAKHSERHRLGIGIARIAVDLEDHHAQQHADLRRRDPGAAERPHCVVEILQQRQKLGRSEFGDRQRYL